MMFDILDNYGFFKEKDNNKLSTSSTMHYSTLRSPDVSVCSQALRIEFRPRCNLSRFYSNKDIVWLPTNATYHAPVSPFCVFIKI